MQADRIQVVVQQAAAGNVEAFTALVQEFAPRLRLALGAHLDQPTALITVEAAVWSAVRARLGEWLTDVPFLEWLMQVAVDPVTAHLAQADRRSIDIQDALGHQIIEQCREALTDGSELQVFDLPSRLAALPEVTRTVLLRRYRERQRPTALAASLMISEAELATTLASARAACDWRGLAQPPGPGDRLLPPLIEDWLNGTIDVDSRALLATNLGRDLERARQFARQVRVHLALSAALAPFSREDAVSITRQTGLGAGDSGRVMMGESPRPVSGPRPPASDARRVARMTTSNRHIVPLDVAERRPSPMPWIIGGGMVLVGMFALIAMSMRAGPAKAVPHRPPDSSPSPVVAASTGTSPSPTSNTTANPGVPATGGVLRLEPGRINAPPPPPPRVALALNGHLYGNHPAVLRADLSHNLGVTAVEFWKGDERMASVAEPFVWTWERPTIGTTSFTLRVMGAAGRLSSSAPTQVTVDQAYGSGTIRREWWMGVEGFVIAEGFKASGYPDRPQGEGDESRFASPRDWNNNYLQRLRGFITPPSDGEYVFWIAGDDESQLWLSRDDKRDGLQLIAVSPMIPNFGIQPEEWEHNQSQRSGGITLKRGQRYYVEVLHKDGIGEDHVAVGWRLPDGRLERPIPGAHLSPPTEPVPASARPPAVVQSSVPTPIPPPVLAPAPVAGGVQLVRSIDFVSSGATYVEGSARNGERVYIDREYKLVDLPPTFEVGRLIRTRSDDDGASANPHLRFTADVAVDVYLAYATSATALPAWMQGWTSTSVVVGADKGGGFRLFRRTFAPGQVVLGANERNTTSASSNYFVLVLPATQAPVAALPVAANPSSQTRRPDLMIWDGDGASGGAGYKGFGNGGQSPLDHTLGQGRSGAGLRARLGGGNGANVGWNWHSWSSDGAGTDLSGFAALSMWVRFTGTVAPQRVVMRLSCSPRESGRRTVDVNLSERQPGLMDGTWHQVIVPFSDLVPAGHNFDRAKVWEIAFDLSGTATMDGTFDVDEIGALRSLIAPAPAAVVPWKVVRAINLGGEATDIDGVRFLGHRQAEAEGASPPTSHQPGPWLSDLNWVRGATGAGEIRRNRSMEDRPLTIDGKVYAKGLGVHANSELVYALDGRYSGFTAVVGLDDEVQPVAEVIFQVWLDAQKVWDSGVMRKGMAKPVAIPLAGRKELRLVVDTSGPGDWDHADWANAQLLVPGGDDGALQVQLGRRATATFAPKPAVDAKARALLGTALVGTKEGLAFRVKAANGPSRVWIWIAENGAPNSRQFDLTVEGITLPGVGLLPAGGWEKLGPIELNLADGHIDVAATALKGTPQVMGIVVEQQAPAP